MHDVSGVIVIAEEEQGRVQFVAFGTGSADDFGKSLTRIAVPPDGQPR